MKRNSLYILIAFLTFLIAGTAVASDVDIHGFLAQGFMQSSDNKFLGDTEKGTFEFNEMGINFATNATSNLKLGMQFFARDLGDVGNDDIIVDWVFGDYSWKEWLGLRVGKLKVGFGLYNETRDIDSLRTSILLPQSVYDEWFRDAGQGLKGVSAYGNVSLASAGLLQYEVQINEVAIPLDSGTGKLIESSPNFSALTAIDPMRVYIGILKWHTPLEGLLLGTSGFVTKTSYNVTSAAGAPLIFKGDLMYYYLSAEYVWENLTLASEWRLTENIRNMYPVAAPAMKLLDDDKLNSTSYYVSSSYRFLDWFEAGIYYSEKITNDDASGPANELKDIALSTRFDVNDFWTIKLEGHQMDGLANVDPNTDGTSDEDWFMYLAKVSYTF